MKKLKLLGMMMLAIVMALVTACSKDDGGGTNTGGNANANREYYITKVKCSNDTRTIHEDVFSYDNQGRITNYSRKIDGRITISTDYDYSTWTIMQKETNSSYYYMHQFNNEGVITITEQKNNNSSSGGVSTYKYDNGYLVSYEGTAKLYFQESNNESLEWTDGLLTMKDVDIVKYSNIPWPECFVHYFMYLIDYRLETSNFFGKHPKYLPLKHLLREFTYERDSRGLVTRMTVKQNIPSADGNYTYEAVYDYVWEKLK